MSGNKIGFRCEGSGCGWGDRPEDITVLEMNFSSAPVLHWSELIPGGERMRE